MRISRRIVPKRQAYGRISRPGNTQETPVAFADPDGFAAELHTGGTVHQEDLYHT